MTYTDDPKYIIDNPDHPQFSTASVCAASGLDDVTLRNIIRRVPGAILMKEEDREKFKEAAVEEAERNEDEEERLKEKAASEEIVTLSDERIGGGPGGRHHFTFRRVVQIALMAELLRHGVPPKKAGFAAAAFTDKGDTVAGFGNGFPIKRLAGQLYLDGQTLLLVRPDAETGEVFNATQSKSFSDLSFSRGPSLLIVNVNEVIRKLKNKLGLDPSWGNAWLYLPAGSKIDYRG